MHRLSRSFLIFFDALHVPDTFGVRVERASLEARSASHLVKRTELKIHVSPDTLSYQAKRYHRTTSETGETRLTRTEVRR